MKTIDKLKKIDRTFLGGEAGSFSGVSRRTVTFWAEEGLINAPTSGTGDRRRYTALQVVEIAIIKALSNDIKNLKVLKTIFNRIRSENWLKKYLENDHAFIVLPIIEDKPANEKGPRVLTTASWMGFGWNNNDQITDDQKNEMLRQVFNEDANNTIVVNISRIANKVLNKL